MQFQFRKLIGNTNPELANSGTIRKLYAVNQTQILSMALIVILMQMWRLIFFK